MYFQFAKCSNQTISVSGFDGNVYIYETQQWSEKESNCPTVKPTFVHKGHEVCLDEDYAGMLTVLHHTWHPSQTQLVLSAANDGSLHAWNYSTQLKPNGTNSDSKEKLEGDKNDENLPDTQLENT